MGFHDGPPRNLDGGSGVSGTLYGSRWSEHGLDGFFLAILSWLSFLLSVSPCFIQAPSRLSFVTLYAMLTSIHGEPREVDRSCP